MDMNLVNVVRTVLTVVCFLLFIGIVWWAWSDRRRADFDAAARLALDDDTPLPAGSAMRKGMDQ